MRAGCSAVIDPLIMVTERLTGKILLKEQNHGDHSSCPVHSSAGRGSAFLALHAGWGYYPSGGLGLIAVVILVLLLLGRL